ncbi:MAG: transporter [Beijerinckiaceae bacterium]
MVAKAFACWPALGFVSTLPALAQEQSAAEENSTGQLAKAAQNPIANLISVPFQFQSNFGVGPYHRPQGVLNFQPVVPITINEDWNLITRWVTPILSQPQLAPNDHREFGLGDFNPSFFLSPARPGEGGIIWGIGPTFLLPTATDKNLGNSRWGAGPSFVALTTEVPWVVGILANNIWSFAGTGNGADVNQMLLQPFVNYNFPHGWNLTSSPIITANRLAPGAKKDR